MCGKKIQVAVKGEEFRKYLGGRLIQDAMSSLSREDREFLISGICSECWETFLER